jgi:hypothetical protein
LDGNEGVVEGGGEVLEAGELAAFHFGFFLGEDFGVEGFLVFEEVPEDAGQFMGHGGDGLGSAEAGFPAAVAELGR